MSSVLPVAPTRGRLRPLGLDEVRITGGFWARRRHTNTTATLGHCRDWMDRVGWTGNFRAAVEGRIERDRRGREFADSEVYKLLEAMAWEAANGGGAPLDDEITALTDLVAPAQAPDGYLGTAFGRPGQADRYSDLAEGHELYCQGHLIQAGVAQARARGEGELAKIAQRAADHVCATFGPGGIEGVCGHPQIESGLVELARLTGRQRYLDQAALFVDRRGHGTLTENEFGRAYFQDDVPVRRATSLRGHAVRALYLAAGAVDVAVETGDDELLAAVVRQWEHAVARRTYLTGGMGSHHRDESFGDDFVLPPDRAYSETCAGVASVMLGWRLLLATGEPRFADLVERTLFNVVATSPAEDGRSFFYANTLHRRHRGVAPAPDTDSPRADSGLRAPWFAVSCCPTNVARTLAQLPAYLATADDEGVQLHQYADADIATSLTGGRGVALRVRTDYPSGGTVTVRIGRSPDRPWTLSLRVPRWATGATASLVDPDGARRPVAPGTAALTRVFRPGDEVRLELPVAPRWIRADPRIDAVRGTVAVQRGPLVYCAESVDLPEGNDVDAVRVDTSVDPEDGPGGTADTAGTVVVAGEVAGGAGPSERAWPYEPLGHAPQEPPPAERTGIVLVPYHSWANRGPSTMRVWLPTTEDAPPRGPDDGPGSAPAPDPASGR
ncbi:glycoside hydrolase family 127 protein [Streptomyces caniscabiei]|uniref:glycoside hydrolase family 127 protein n=2 Tax=Streptomyces caniscabiei TaxID=2746961 RepID=UPI0029B2A8C9|nr:beta-L-arabinofuranosidase domain-containing protein [Streptomyces caniscabiei]MDX2605115.1 glycoside hydrolase family 127 protein [Streptomyces caniscabiei]MDX2735495.1 glycoside hydrolase family 127 protein [Streptomyces caniscabiei]